jgi:UDP-xylose/UDP-N-acetylglucosamine transporter B4
VQTISVLLVTLGVVLTTVSASQPKSASAQYAFDPRYSYAIGIGILSLALLLSGILGLVQDRMYERYGRPNLSAPVPTPVNGNGNGHSGKHPSITKQKAPEAAWQESMFYLHFLALPMFYFVRQDLTAQFHSIHIGPARALPTFSRFPLLAFVPLDKLPQLPFQLPTLHVPAAYLPLLLNTLTQLLCVAGVHRLTTAVSSLSVTLVLVVRKATSLVLSVLVLRAGATGDVHLMWFGACLVLLGTVGYSLGSGRAGKERTRGKRQGKKGRGKGKVE